MSENPASCSDTAIRCPLCGQDVKLRGSLLGGRVVAPHRPKHNTKSAEIFENGDCTYSGTVMNEPHQLAKAGLVESHRFEIGEMVYRITRGSDQTKLANWQQSCPEFCEPYFVQRVTAQRVYIEALWIFDEPAMILSRPGLERNGYTFGRDYALFFVSMPSAYRKLTIGYHRAEPARAIFGLPADFSQEDLTKAYRRSAMATHPDRGGTKEDFQAVQAAYEQLRK